MAILKPPAEVVAIHLTGLFNLSLSIGEIPDSFRMTELLLIHKQRSRHDRTNYRLVSRLLVLLQLLKRRTRDAVGKHLMRNDLISQNCHSFFSNKSCLTNLLFFLDDVTTR